jgi:hypothetical protein
MGAYPGLKTVACFRRKGLLINSTATQSVLNYA